ncbi:class I SAM-dependent methyltransferase [Actinomadura sp. DC4]|uniref:class I SAM-dependent methyltransferase n=1 Tax=Actinomadura sp. DC4 TaxID=3055069 RepID=UPI0025B09E11|nr:class I SAM-dependent methyltransferase [Actinomadura sp. DC4]MDN3352518.1 class I SAM-dependent methyltransferase [Actinomadura sp. DC4]
MTDLRTPPIHDGGLFPARVQEYARERPLQRLSILDAGCGWAEEIELDSVECVITGVDDDLPALCEHTRIRRDLDTWQLGDLRTVPMPPRVYDVVRALHLIERIPHAELVLDRFVAALKPGGLMVVRFRDRETAFGYLDRSLPHWPRHLLWHHEQAPPAVYDRIVSMEGMRWYCMMRGLVIAEEYTSRDTMTGFGRFMGVVVRALSLLSRNRLTSAYSEVTLVIRKPENRFARII